MQQLEPFILPLFTYGEPFNGWTVTPGALRWNDDDFPIEIVAYEGVDLESAEKILVGYLEALDVVTDEEGVRTLWATGRTTPGVFTKNAQAPYGRSLMPTINDGIWTTGIDGSRTLVQGGTLKNLTVIVAPA